MSAQQNTPTQAMSAHNIKLCKALIYGTSLIVVMGVSSILPVLPKMAQELQISEASLGVLVYSFTLPGIFLAPVGGILSDRLGRKAVLIPCLCIFALAGIGASFASSLNELIFWRLLQGSGAACLGVLYTTIAGDVFTDKAERLKIMSHAASILSFGIVLFPSLGGILGEIGWQWSLRLSVLALPVLALGFVTTLPPIARNDMRSYAANTKKILLQKKSIFCFLLTFCVFCVLYGPLVTYFPLLASMQYGLSPSQIGILFAISAIGTSTASLLLPLLNTRLPQKVMVIIGSLLFAISMFCFMHWSSSLPFWALSLPILCYGLGQGFAYPSLLNHLSTLAPNSGRGAIMAVNGTTLRLSQSVAPFICGYMFHTGSFTAVFFFGLCAALTILFIIPSAFKSQDVDF